MNALAVRQDGVLIPREFMQQHNLRGGDVVRLTYHHIWFPFEVPMTIVGTFELFPTWYPDRRPLFVGNLDYFFEQAGSQFPYEVWLSVQPGVDLLNLGDDGLTDLNARVFELGCSPT